MGLERMVCCGALTRVYSDENNRKHEKGCKHYKPENGDRKPHKEG